MGNMPRACYPARPILVVPYIMKEEKLYCLVSYNGYTYHHADNKWRVYRKKDERTYTYKSYSLACKKCGEFNQLWGHWLPI